MEKKVRKLIKIISAVFFQKDFYVSREKFCSKIFFSRKLCFFHFFSTLSYLFCLSVLKLCCRNLKRLIWKPNKKFYGKNFFLLLCSFVSFADTEIPSDFRWSFSTGLSKVYPECSVDRYQQKHTFRENSNFLHVFGLSVRKMRTVGEKASQELQMRNLCI